MTIEVKFDGFYLDGNHLPLYSGTVHYWRLARDLWKDILDNVRGMGFRIVETYVPWGIHEMEKGRFDFGELDQKKDIDAFLTLWEEKGFCVLVRPGPHINAELTYFGYPKRVLMDPEVQARTADGAPAILPLPPKQFPIPSYASEKFYSEVATYFDALCPILKRHLYPEGGIIGIQSDNETSFFFRTATYDLDYSEASVELYQKFLQGKYQQISELNRIYRSKYLSFAEILPPREFAATCQEQLPYYLDWSEYKEYYIIYAVRRVAEMMRERGLVDIPIYHNAAAIYPKTPFNMIQTERVIDIMGVDIYPHKEDYDQIKAGVTYTVATSQMPSIPEVGSGVWFWCKPLMPEDVEFTTLATFMHGIKAINYYMIVERERWVGSPITRDNRRRGSYYEFYRKLNQILQEIEYAHLRKKSPILLLANRDYDRLESACQLLPLPFPGPFAPFEAIPLRAIVSQDDLGFQEAIQIESQNWWEGFYNMLCAARYGFALSDTELSQDGLSQYVLVIVPTFEFMKAETQDHLLSYVNSGGIVVLGPRVPYLNENMEPCGILATYLEEPVDVLAEAELAGGLRVRSAYVFRDHIAEGEAFLQHRGRPLAYLKKVGRGKIVHLGFLLPRETGVSWAWLIERLCSLAGIKRETWCDDPEVDLTLHEGRGRKVIFVANPSAKMLDVNLRTESPLHLRDVWSGEKFDGSDSLKITLKGFMVRILEVV